MFTTLELRHSSLKILFRFSRWAKTSFPLSTAFPFCLLQSLSVSWPHWESLLLLLSCPLRVGKYFHYRVELRILFSFGVGVWGRRWFCTVCFQKKASSRLLGALSYSSYPELDRTDWNSKLNTASQKQKHLTKPGPINSATTKWQKSYWRSTRCQTVILTEDLLHTKLWLLLRTDYVPDCDHYWRPTRCQTVIVAEDQLGTRLWLLLKTD